MSYAINGIYLLVTSIQHSIHDRFIEQTESLLLINDDVNLLNTIEQNNFLNVSFQKIYDMTQVVGFNDFHSIIGYVLSFSYSRFLFHIQYQQQPYTWINVSYDTWHFWRSMHIAWKNYSQPIVVKYTHASRTCFF